MSDIGERLREEVEKLGGITAASRAVGTATNTIYNWIDKGNVPANKLAELMAVGADVMYIMTGMRTQQIQAPPPAQPVIEAKETQVPESAEEFSQQEKVIVKKLRMLDPKERDEIEEIVKIAEQAKTSKVRFVERMRKAS